MVGRCNRALCAAIRLGPSWAAYIIRADPVQGVEASQKIIRRVVRMRIGSNNDIGLRGSNGGIESA
jgi:hypothetical protein